MSTAEPLLAELSPLLPAAAPNAWTRFDSLLERGGEWLNPILVKECRQALKSKQFTITFALLLTVGWLWSLIGVASMGDSIRFSFDSGPYLFYWYYFFLAFALLVVVPFSSFRSLAIEREDNTFDLVSISTLTPRQIVAGKLGSSIMQMLVYFSALLPCLAFTYLLRGIDLPTIGFLTFYLFLGSLGFSMAALFIATVSREKHWQSVLAVIIIVGLFSAYVPAMIGVKGMLTFQRISFTDRDFWTGNAAFMTAYASYFLLIYLAACAQLTFPTDNRSSKLRYAMLLQQLLFSGWVGWGLLTHEGRDVAALLAYITVLGMHWGLMGALMTGEMGQLSARIRRDLPQSFLGRAAFSWFNPGPTTGYVFAVANLLAACTLATLLVLGWESQGLNVRWRGMNSVGDVFVYGLGMLSYVTIFVGLGNLLVGLIRRKFAVGMLLTMVLQFSLLLFGIFTPMIVRGMLLGRYAGYDWLQISDPFSTLSELSSYRNSMSADGVQYVLAFVAMAVFLANLPRAASELEQTRIAKPKRVLEEDAALVATVQPPPAASDPWEAAEQTS